MRDFERQPDMWPLKRGDTLSNHDWFPFFGHRFLGSGFLSRAIMEDRRADVGTAVMLWSVAMQQDPAGTLPESDTDLAFLARFASVEDWLSVRAGVLDGWEPVLVEDERTGEVITRLGHPGFMQGVVEEMHKRKRGRDGAREAARFAVRKSRLRKKMGEMQIPAHIIENDKAIHAVAEYFEQSDLYMTPDNVRAAMAEVLGYTGEVTHFPGKAGGRDR